MSLQPLTPGTFTTSGASPGLLILAPKTAGTFGRFPSRSLLPSTALLPSAGSKLVPLHATTL